MFLARKIYRAKWPRSPVPLGQIPADAVTADLRTSRNRLSFWRFRAEDEVERAALAIAAAGEQVGKFDIVWIDERDLHLASTDREVTPGKTGLVAWQDRHVDLVATDYEGLGQIAQAVRDAVLANHWKRFSRERVACLLASGMASGIVARADLSEPLLRRLDSASSR